MVQARAGGKLKTGSIGAEREFKAGRPHGTEYPILFHGVGP